MALVLGATTGWAHPLHTSLAELGYDAASRTLTVSFRLYADDFSAAVARSGRVARTAGGMVPEAAMQHYVAGRFALTGPTGTAIPLTWCGARRAGDMLFLCLRAPVAGPPSGLLLRNALLVEAFDDQVNIVQTLFRGSRRTTLFTKGDGPKRLP